MRPIVGGRGAEQLVAMQIGPTQFELRGAIELPEDDEMREALDIGEPRLKLGQDLEHTIGLVFSAKTLGNFACVPVRTGHKSNWARGEHFGTVPPSPIVMLLRQEFSSPITIQGLCSKPSCSGGYNSQYDPRSP